MQDYRTMPGVSEAIEHYKEMRERDWEDERKAKAIQIASYFRWEPGKRLMLEIVVTDTDLFELVAGSMHSAKSALSIPGAGIEAIHFREPMGKDIIIGWLESKIRELREE